MQILDLTFATPAENLACDEALLDWREENGGEEILRFWESPETFAVVGYANKIATEVNVENCRASQTPVFRRCSGGGTVLQGAGCLNYALILRITGDGPCRTITSANRFIMEKNRTAVESVFKAKDGIRRTEISVCGHTDLALDGRKFSGNSQRRKKTCLLFHGTFLLDFNLALVADCLRTPSNQPDYRRHRSHREFLTNLNLPAAEVKAALKKSWGAIDRLAMFPKLETRKLAEQKYSSDEWNFKL
jgi:lipoate-protein ligase A